MLNPVPLKSVLDEATSAFIQQAVSINIATRNGDRQPALARAYGCLVSTNRTDITLFLDRNRSREVVENIQKNEALAVVFSRPATLETLQLKGGNAGLADITDSHRAVINRYRTAFTRELQSIGFSANFADAILEHLDDELVAVRFTPAEAFVATPGPLAGQPLRP